jgi:hypothetical protein
MDAYIHTCLLDRHNPEMKFYRIQFFCNYSELSLYAVAFLPRMFCYTFIPFSSVICVAILLALVKYGRQICTNMRYEVLTFVIIVL